MRQACRKLARCVPTCPASVSVHGLRPTEFRTRFLDMTFRKYILALHAPFTVPARRDPRCYDSRKVSLASTLAIVSYAKNLDPPAVPTDDVSKLLLAGTGSTMADVTAGTAIEANIGLGLTQKEMPPEERVSIPRTTRMWLTIPLRVSFRQKTRPSALTSPVGWGSTI